MQVQEMKAKIIEQTSTNRGEFNRAYKHYLEKKGKIHCSYCPYHRCENGCGTKMYGSFGGERMRYPNWKLVSKQPKQWMKKPTRIVTRSSGFGNWKRTYVEIKFST